MNVYRCQFDIDAQLVPGGCDAAVEPEPLPQTPQNLGPIPYDEENEARLLEIQEFRDNCDYRGDASDSKCHHPRGFWYPDLVSTIELSRLRSELYNCDMLLGATGYCQRRDSPGPDIWVKRMELAQYLGACRYGTGARPSGFSQSRYQCYRDPADPSVLAGPEHNAEAIRLGREAFQCNFELPNSWGNLCGGTHAQPGSFGGGGMFLIFSSLLCPQGWLDLSYVAERACYHFDHPEYGREWFVRTFGEWRDGGWCVWLDLDAFPDQVRSSFVDIAEAVVCR